MTPKETIFPIGKSALKIGLKQAKILKMQIFSKKRLQVSQFLIIFVP